MKRLAFLVAILPATFGVFLATAPAHAGLDVPTQCEVPQFPQPAVSASNLPNCADIVGLCISFHIPNGPSRAVHPLGGASIPEDGDCTDFPRECRVDVFPPNDGPARAVHATSVRAVPSGLTPGDIFNIPPECLEIPSTGFDVAPVLVAGLAVLGVGIVLAGLRRRLA